MVSKAGRDVGRRFVIINVIDDLYVQISDGDLRKVERPKKKKLKHLETTGTASEILTEKLYANARITNADIRKALAGLADTLENKS